MVNLDSLAMHRKYDTSGMFRHLKNFPEQCHSAWNKVMDYRLPSDYDQINRVVIVGMGGSAIGGEVVSNLLAEESTVPIWVVRDFNLPHFIDERTLVITISYSGNTEETLSAFQQVLKTPAKKLVLTAGGQLAELAKKENVFFSIIDYPAPPRATFPYMFASLVGIFNKLGLLPEKSADMKQAIASLSEMVDQMDITVPRVSNRAKMLAEKLQDKVIITYGAGVLMGVARRWKTQFNENSKNWAFFEVFPELIHNAICGYAYPEKAKKNLFTILLRVPSLHSRIKVQYEAVIKILEDNEVPYEVIDGIGDNIFTKVLGLILLGDFTSYYLAILNRVDPTPVSFVNFIKQYMADYQGE